MIPSFDRCMELTRTISSETAFSDDELDALYRTLLRVDRGRVIVEIGCQLGRSSSMILQLAPALSLVSVHIDPWTVQPDYAAGWHRMAHTTGSSHCVLQMRTDQALALQFFPDQLGLVLIDGDHTDAGVRVDLGMAERIAPGGWLLAHDYGRDSLPDVYAVLTPYVNDGRWRASVPAGSLGIWQRI